MNIKIEYNKKSNEYKADLLDIPGTPPVGIASNVELAIVRLFYGIMKDYNNYKKYIELDSGINIMYTYNPHK